MLVLGAPFPARVSLMQFSRQVQHAQISAGRSIPASRSLRAFTLHGSALQRSPWAPKHGRGIQGLKEGACPMLSSC